MLRPAGGLTADGLWERLSRSNSSTCPRRLPRGRANPAKTARMTTTSPGTSSVSTRPGVIRHKGPWEFEEVEFATREWVDRLTHRRLLEPLGQVPPAWLGQAYYHHAAAKEEEGLKQAALRWTRSGSVHEIVSNRAGKAFRTANLLVDAMCVERQEIPRTGGPPSPRPVSRSLVLLRGSSLKPRGLPWSSPGPGRSCPVCASGSKGSGGD